MCFGCFRIFVADFFNLPSSNIRNRCDIVRHSMSTLIHADLLLARRLERAEALSNASFVEAHARLNPESGAEWIEVAGAYAMFDGVHSPCTQTFGLGVFQLPSEAELGAIEKFFKMHGAPIFHEVSPSGRQRPGFRCSTSAVTGRSK